MKEAEDKMEEVRQLVIRAKAGDSEAFGALYSSFYTPIYRFIFFLVRHREESEDLTQTVFVKTFEALGRFEDRGVKFGTWLYTIARNTVIDYWKKKRSVVTLERETLENLEGDTGDRESDLVTDEAVNFVKCLVATLSPDQAEIITLYFIEELSYAEISEITGKREEAVRALKHRALKSLRGKVTASGNKYGL